MEILLFVFIGFVSGWVFGGEYFLFKYDGETEEALAEKDKKIKELMNQIAEERRGCSHTSKEAEDFKTETDKLVSDTVFKINDGLEKSIDSFWPPAEQVEKAALQAARSFGAPDIFYHNYKITTKATKPKKRNKNVKSKTTKRKK
jgi:hypothetical protein